MWERRPFGNLGKFLAVGTARQWHKHPHKCSVMLRLGLDSVDTTISSCPPSLTTVIYACSCDNSCRLDHDGTFRQLRGFHK